MCNTRTGARSWIPSSSSVPCARSIERLLLLKLRILTEISEERKSKKEKEIRKRTVHRERPQKNATHCTGAPAVHRIVYDADCVFWMLSHSDSQALRLQRTASFAYIVIQCVNTVIHPFDNRLWPAQSTLHSSNSSEFFCSFLVSEPEHLIEFYLLSRLLRSSEELLIAFSMTHQFMWHEMVFASKILPHEWTFDLQEWATPSHRPSTCTLWRLRSLKEIP